MTFWWKVSSELTNDKLIFYVNGVEQARISGEVDWQQKTFAIGTGTATLLWTYSKNGSVSAGQDHGWVDQFQFTPTPEGHNLGHNTECTLVAAPRANIDPCWGTHGAARSRSRSRTSSRIHSPRSGSACGPTA